MKHIIWLTNARIFSILIVVLAHTAQVIVINNEIGSSNWWIGNVYDILGRWSVPVFVMVSGALLLDPNKKEDLKEFYQKRISRILMPILFWSVFFIYISLQLGKSWFGYEPTLSNYLRELAAGAPFYHMWFLFMIIGLYLFTPFFRKLVEHTTRSELKIFVLLGFIIAILNTAYSDLFSTGDQPILFITRFLPYVPFFFAGYLINTSNIKPNKYILWLIFIASISLTVVGRYYLGLHKDENFGYYIFESLSITLVPMSISIMFLLKSWVKPIINPGFSNKLASQTLGIYLIHPVILFTIFKFLQGVDSFHLILLIPVIAFVTYLISLTFALCISKVPIINRII